MNSTTVSTISGVLFEIFVADFFTVLGLSGQKLALQQSPSSTNSYFTWRTKWFIYLLVFIFGQAVEAISLTLASQTDIAAVSNLTLLWSALFSSLWFGEHFHFSPPRKLKRLAKQISFSVSHPNEAHATGTEALLGTSNTKYGTTLTPVSSEAQSPVSPYEKVNRLGAINTGTGKRGNFAKSKIRKCFDQTVETLIGWDLLNYCLLLLGSILTVISSPPQVSTKKVTAENLLEDWTRFPYCLYGLILILVIVFFGIYLSRHWNKQDENNNNVLAVIVANLAAILSGITITLSKMFLTIIDKILKHEKLYKIPVNVPGVSDGQSDVNLSKSMTIAIYVVLLLVWIGLVVSYIIVLNVGLARFEQRIIVPIYEISGTIVTITSSILFYKTYEDFNGHNLQLFGFISGIILMCAGIYLVSIRDQKPDFEYEEENRKEDLLTDDGDMRTQRISLLKNQL